MSWTKKISNPTVADERIKFQAWRHDGGPKYKIVKVMQILESGRVPSWSGREYQTYQRWAFKDYIGDVPFIEFHPGGEMIIDYFFSLEEAKKMIQIIESDPDWANKVWDTTDGTKVKYESKFDKELRKLEDQDPNTYWDM